MAVMDEERTELRAGSRGRKGEPRAGGCGAGLPGRDAGSLSPGIPRQEDEVRTYSWAGAYLRLQG